MIHLALHDALNNQQKQGAKVVLTLRGGAELTGKLKPPPTGSTYHEQTTVMLETRVGGWHTVLIDELAAVGAAPDRL